MWGLCFTLVVDVLSYYLSYLHQTCMDDASCLALLMELKELDAESAS